MLDQLTGQLAWVRAALECPRARSLVIVNPVAVESFESHANMIRADLFGVGDIASAHFDSIPSRRPLASRALPDASKSSVIRLFTKMCRDLILERLIKLTMTAAVAGTLTMIAATIVASTV